MTWKHDQEFASGSGMNSEHQSGEGRNQEDREEDAGNQALHPLGG